ELPDVAIPRPARVGRGERDRDRARRLAVERGRLLRRAREPELLLGRALAGTGPQEGLGVAVDVVRGDPVARAVEPGVAAVVGEHRQTGGGDLVDEPRLASREHE